MKNIKIIKSNSNKEEGSFIGKLNEGEFDKVLFNSFVKCVYDVHNSELKDTERLSIACELWAISLDISQSLACNYNIKDVYFIKGITEEEKIELFDIIQLIPSYFTFNKPMKLKDMFI